MSRWTLQESKPHNEGVHVQCPVVPKNKTDAVWEGEGHDHVPSVLQAALSGPNSKAPGSAGGYLPRAAMIGDHSRRPVGGIGLHIGGVHLAQKADFAAPLTVSNRNRVCVPSRHRSLQNLAIIPLRHRRGHADPPNQSAGKIEAAEIEIALDAVGVVDVVVEEEAQEIRFAGLDHALELVCQVGVVADENDLPYRKFVTSLISKTRLTRSLLARIVFGSTRTRSSRTGVGNAVPVQALLSAPLEPSTITVRMREHDRRMAEGCRSAARLRSAAWCRRNRDRWRSRLR